MLLEKYLVSGEGFFDSKYVLRAYRRCMKNEYLDSAANIPVRVDGRLEKELKDKAGKVLVLQRKGAKLIFPDVFSIEQELL